MAGYSENKKFRDDIFGDLLDTVLEWIDTNMAVDDVFDQDKVIEYVTNNVDIDDVYADKVIIEYVAETCTPDEVFTVSDLETWAEDNGWERKLH